MENTWTSSGDFNVLILEYDGEKNAYVLMENPYNNQMIDTKSVSKQLLEYYHLDLLYIFCRRILPYNSTIGSYNTIEDVAIFD